LGISVGKGRMLEELLDSRRILGNLIGHLKTFSLRRREARSGA